MQDTVESQSSHSPEPCAYSTAIQEQAFQEAITHIAHVCSLEALGAFKNQF